MKFKKVISAAAAAAIALSMTSGIAVSAEEAADLYEGASIVADMNAADPVWTECKKLAGGKYSSTYVKMINSYSKKKATTGIRFGKSRTKSFFNKLQKAANSKEPNFSLSLVSKDTITAVASKGDKAKVVMYMPGDDMNIGMAIYADSKSMTVVSPDTKLKMTTEIPEGTDASEATGTDFDAMFSDFGIQDDTKGKVFKFKNGEKNYVYEEFESETGSKLGVLFDSSNKPLAMMDDTGVYCCTFSTSVKDSAFTVPSGYSELQMDE